MIGTTYLTIKNPDKWNELEKQFIQDINELFEEWEKEKTKSIKDIQYNELLDY